jgi:hypothetical protein
LSVWASVWADNGIFLRRSRSASSLGWTWFSVTVVKKCRVKNDFIKNDKDERADAFLQFKQEVASNYEWALKPLYEVI